MAIEATTTRVCRIAARCDKQATITGAYDVVSAEYLTPGVHPTPVTLMG